MWPMSSYFKTVEYGTLFDGIFFDSLVCTAGIYFVVYFVSAYFLLGRPGFLSSPPSTILVFSITTLMFVLGVTYLVLGAAVLLFVDPMNFLDWVSPPTHIKIFMAVGVTIPRVMYILSGAICAWRAALIWGKDRRVIAILLLFILGTIAIAGCDLGLSLAPLFQVGSSYKSIQENSIVNLSMLQIVPTLGNTLLSTGLIAWKAWEHHFFVKYIGEGNVSMRVGKILALLIESGLVYCCFWILYLISSLGLCPYPVFAVIDSVSLFISGLYSTLIVVLVCFQKSPIDHYTMHLAQMQMYDKVYNIRRESVSVNNSETQVPSAASASSLNGQKSKSTGNLGM